MRDNLIFVNYNNTPAMDTFGNEVDKLLQQTRREQEETEERGNDRSKKTSKQHRSRPGSRYRAKQREDISRSDHDEVQDTSYRGSKDSRDFSGRFVDSARTSESNSPSLSITINNSRRGRNDSRRYAPSGSKRARGPDFSQFNNGPAWSGAKSFDYGHGSINPLQTAGPTPSTSRCSPSSSGLHNRLDDPGMRQSGDVSAAKLAEATATAQLLKVGTSMNDRRLMLSLCQVNH